MLSFLCSVSLPIAATLLPMQPLPLVISMPVELTTYYAVARAAAGEDARNLVGQMMQSVTISDYARDRGLV